jgi:hypothetical protein
VGGGEGWEWVWTGPEANGADERLPLLSDRERQHLLEGSRSKERLAEPKRQSSPRPPDHRLRAEGQGRLRDRRAAPPDRQQVQMDRNNAAGAPRRHGLSWSAAEDGRLRAAFLAGDAIAAIASAHQRKIGAITARLVRLGLISQDGVVEPG